MFPGQDGQAEERRETEGKTRAPGPQRSLKGVDVDSEGNEKRDRDLTGLLFSQISRGCGAADGREEGAEASIRRPWTVTRGRGQRRVWKWARSDQTAGTPKSPKPQWFLPPQLTGPCWVEVGGGVDSWKRFHVWYIPGWGRGRSVGVDRSSRRLTHAGQAGGRSSKSAGNPEPSASFRTCPGPRNGRTLHECENGGRCL